MKIVFLNTWYGRIGPKIFQYIEEQAKDTDIFCFQEANEKLTEPLENILVGFNIKFAEKPYGKDDGIWQAVYVKKNLPIISSGVVLEEQNDCGLGLYVVCEFESQHLYICNFHGASDPSDKLDSANRLIQSRELIDLFKDKDGLKVIGGDFNTLPDTESIKSFEENGYMDLIKKYDIKTTRNHLAWDRYPEKERQDYADYIFTSQNITERSFSVEDLEISDHLPLILTF